MHYAVVVLASNARTCRRAKLVQSMMHDFMSNFVALPVPLLGFLSMHVEHMIDSRHLSRA